MMQLAWAGLIRKTNYTLRQTPLRSGSDEGTEGLRRQMSTYRVFRLLSKILGDFSHDGGFQRNWQRPAKDA